MTEKNTFLFLIIASFFLVGCTQPAPGASATPTLSTPSALAFPTSVPEICTQEYDPVCGTNGKTYSNECFALRDKIPVDHTGACNNTNPPGGNTCHLLIIQRTGQVGCFGCAGNPEICKDPDEPTEPYKSPEIGIPYACFPGPNGCELAQ